jgi:hypothetical protein
VYSLALTPTLLSVGYPQAKVLVGYVAYVHGLDLEHTSQDMFKMFKMYVFWPYEFENASILREAYSI